MITLTEIRLSRVRLYYVLQILVDFIQLENINSRLKQIDGIILHFEIKETEEATNLFYSETCKTDFREIFQIRRAFLYE
jgi:hypothetical protein